MRALRFGKMAAFGVALACAPPLWAQPTIEHADVSCLPRGEFTQFLASIQPASTIRAAKLYFRSNLYREFYFVAMRLGDAGSFEAVMPLPSEETTKVVYYIEAVDLSFQTSRSEELEVSVSEGERCRRGPGAVLFPGGDPGIVVGATQAGIPAIPAGFQASGITGFITAAGGTAATGGGGIGVGVAVGAAAGAAAGVGIIVAAGGEAADGTGPAGPPTPPMGGAGTTSTASSPSPPSSSSTTTSPPSGGSTTTTGPSTSSITTTIPPSTTTSTALPTLTACFTWQALGSCRVYFDSCSTPPNLIERYEWRMLGPPVPAPPQLESFTFDFAGDPRCLGTMSFNHPVRLTVFDGFGRSDSVQQNVSVQPGASYRTEEGTSARLSLTSQLVALPADGSARGQIAINGARLAPSDNASASRHEVRVGMGIVRIEATLLTRVSPGSLWELDFSSSESVVRGSLRAEGGSVVGADDGRIVFRLNGDRGETLRLRLEVE